MRHIAYLFSATMILGMTVGGCAFLLDTDSLKNGTGEAADAGTDVSAGGHAGSDAGVDSGGMGGSDAGGSAGADAGADSGEEAGAVCTNDDFFFTCDDKDPCTVDYCDPPSSSSGHCAHQDHKGKVIGYADPGNPIATPVLGVDRLGPPALINDGKNFYLAVWQSTKSGSVEKTAIKLFKYEAAKATPAQSAVLDNTTMATTPYSSPAMFILPKKIAKGIKQDYLLLTFVAKDSSSTPKTGIVGEARDTNLQPVTSLTDIGNAWPIGNTSLDSTCNFDNNNADYAEQFRPHATALETLDPNKSPVAVAYRCNKGVGITYKPTYDTFGASTTSREHKIWTDAHVSEATPLVSSYDNGGKLAFELITSQETDGHAFRLSAWSKNNEPKEKTSVLFSGQSGVGVDTGNYGGWYMVRAAALDSTGKALVFSSGSGCVPTGCQDSQVTTDQDTTMVYPGVDIQSVPSKPAQHLVTQAGFAVEQQGTKVTLTPLSITAVLDLSTPGTPKTVFPLPYNPLLFLFDKEAATFDTSKGEMPPVRNLVVSSTPDGHTMIAWLFQDSSSQKWGMKVVHLIARSNGDVCK